MLLGILYWIHMTDGEPDEEYLCVVGHLTRKRNFEIRYFRS